MKSKLSDLLAAVRLGRDCRNAAEIGGREFENQFDPETDDGLAWRAGYENDLDLWMKVYRRADKDFKATGRLRSMDRVVFNAHTNFPDRGYFLGYAKRKGGYCRVHLERAGTTCVPRVSLVPELDVNLQHKEGVA